MRMSGGDKLKHRHWWNPPGNIPGRKQVCECGALREWDNGRWRVRAKKVLREHKPREKDEEFGGNGLERTDVRE